MMNNTRRGPAAQAGPDGIAAHPRAAPVPLAAQPDAERWELAPQQLDLQMVPEELGFRTTAELEPLTEVVGQPRALDALAFGLAMPNPSYNLYVSGLCSRDKHAFLERLITPKAAHDQTPDDWTYVYNFAVPAAPLAVRLPAGDGVRFRQAMADMIEQLRRELPALLNNSDYVAERDRLASLYGRRSEAMFAELVERARVLGIGLHRQPNGTLTLIPLKDGKPIEPSAFDALSDEERAEIQRRVDELEEMAQGLSQRQQPLARQLRGELDALYGSLARQRVEPLVIQLKDTFPSPALIGWFDLLQTHLLEHLDRFQDSEAPHLNPLMQALTKPNDPWLEYRVNLVVDHANTKGAPVVLEYTPNYKNLFGSIERETNVFGRVTTDFTQIEAGSVLRASGGYLILDLNDALTEPLVWKQLKRCLKSGELHPDAYEPLMLFSTVALKPKPIPLNTKVVAIGPAELYQLLRSYDDDFGQLFKAWVDFDDEMARTGTAQRHYSQFIAGLVRAEGLPPFDAAAVLEVLRFGVRTAGNRGKLSADFGAVADVVREAGLWAQSQRAAATGADHVRTALDQRVYRTERVATKVRELIREDVLRIAVTGSRVGQVNGLALWDASGVVFGRPVQVSASVGIGQEGIVNIERESRLSGRTHDKGVLILEGYLRNAYAHRVPLSLTASITFEQSYGFIEGDSASLAELCCLLSALVGLPLRQDIALTGSVNQHGEIQAVGGINEKIEGFFAVCREKGLTGTQGVCIPRANVHQLVLHPDVIRTVVAGEFHVWAIDSVDQAIELLTGLRAGSQVEEMTFHHQVGRRLEEMRAALCQQPGAAAGSRLSLPGSVGSRSRSAPRLPSEND